MKSTSTFTRTRRLSFWIVLLLVGSVGQALAQEIWISPMPWYRTTFDDTNRDRVHDGYETIFSDDTDWTEVAGETHVWRTFMNMLRDEALLGCEPDSGMTPPERCDEKPLTTAELEAMVEFTQAQGYKVAFETGGILLHNITSCNVTGFGAAAATFEQGLLDRWADTTTASGSGQIHYITADHAITNALKKMDAYCTIDLSVIEDLIEEFVDYADDMQDYYSTNYGMDVEVGLIEAPHGFEMTTSGGLSYPNRLGFLDGIEFTDFWDLLLDEMSIGGVTLDHFLTDAGPQALRNDGDPIADVWDHGRHIEVEQIVVSDNIRFGLMMHPGSDYNQPLTGVTDAVADRGVYDLMQRMIEEYKAAGGISDVAGVFSWHSYPTVLGPEDTAFTWFNLARDVLDVRQLMDGRMSVDYFSDDFTSNDAFTSSGRWQDYDGKFTASGGEITSSSGAGIARAELDAEELDDFFIEFDLDFATSASPSVDWAGVQFRKTSVGDAPWTSGYSLLIDEDGDVRLLSGTQIPATELASAPGAVDTSAPLRVRVEAVDSTIRVLIDSERVFLLENETDWSSGQISLSTYGQAASFDNVEISTHSTPTAAFANGFAGSSPLQNWDVSGSSGTWQVPTGSQYLEQTHASGLARLSRQGNASRDSFWLSTLVRFSGTATGWAGVVVRGTHSQAPWNEGYTIFFADGTSGPEVKIDKGGNGSAIVAAADVEGLDPTQEFAQLEVIFIDHRLVVYVNGKQHLDHFDEDFELGEISLATFNQAADFDEVILDTLDE